MRLSPSCPPPVENPSTPDLRLPDHSVDGHCHVFGPRTTFPFDPNRTFTPVDVPRRRLRALHDLLGFERAVVVQSAVHGSDHSAMLDALAASDGRYRGVALVTGDTPPERIAAWSDAGVCGARLNFLPHLGAAPSRETIDRIVGRIRPYGWHLSIHVTGDGISRYAELISSIPVPVVIDHMARVDLGQGVGGPDVSSLLRLLDTGRVWVKLSGADRISGGPVPSERALRYAGTLAAHAPERVVWGTDFPHPNIAGAPPDDGKLLDTLAIVAPDERLRHRILVDNPSELFGFATNTTRPGGGA